jgi:hypothetical protein
MKVKTILPILVGFALAGGTTHAQTPQPSQSAPPTVYTYKFTPNKPLRYKIVAYIKGIIPVLNSVPSEDMDATLTLVYDAIPSVAPTANDTNLHFNVVSADAEVEKIPFPIDPQQAAAILNQSITLAPTGQVVDTAPSQKLPFSITIPGVDPTKFYSLLLPIVFPQTPIAPGDTWTFDNPFFGNTGAPPVTNAVFLPAPKGTNPAISENLLKDPFIPHSTDYANFGEQFSLKIDQKLDQAKKPVPDGVSPYQTRNGFIMGEGIFSYDKKTGVFTKGEMLIKAEILDKILGVPVSPDIPKETNSHIKAKVMIKLLGSPTSTTATTSEKTQ